MHGVAVVLPKEIVCGLNSVALICGSCGWKLQKILQKHAEGDKTKTVSLFMPESSVANLANILIKYHINFFGRSGSDEQQILRAALVCVSSGPGP